MSSLNDTLAEDEAERLYFPSQASGGRRLLRLKGRDVTNGSRNSYALARSDGLPEHSVLSKGLSSVSPLVLQLREPVAWVSRAICKLVDEELKYTKPNRWILYHHEKPFNFRNLLRNTKKTRGPKTQVILGITLPLTIPISNGTST